MKPPDERPRAQATVADHRPKLRAISEALPRTFSTAPGAMGYLAPPRAAPPEPKRYRLGTAALMIGLLAAAGIGGYLLVAFL